MSWSLLCCISGDCTLKDLIISGGTGVLVRLLNDLSLSLHCFIIANTHQILSNSESCSCLSSFCTRSSSVCRNTDFTIDTINQTKHLTSNVSDQLLLLFKQGDEPDIWCHFHKRKSTRLRRFDPHNCSSEMSDWVSIPLRPRWVVLASSAADGSVKLGAADTDLD